MVLAKAFQSWASRQAHWPYFWLPFVAVLTLVLARHEALFLTPADPWGDSAINGLSILRAEHLQQLVGNYSRVGFNHPGPFFFYLQAAGSLIGFRWLHLVAGPYNGALLAVDVYVACAVAAACVIVRLTARSGPAAILAGAMSFAFLAHSRTFANDWFPNLYIPAFLVFVLAAGAVCAGYTTVIPFYLAAAGILAHGHASFLLFVGVTTLMCVLLWGRQHRAHLNDELREHRRAVLAAGVTIVLFTLPVLVDLILHFPGQWPSYFQFAGGAELQPRSVEDVAEFWLRYWTITNLRLRFYLIAGVVAIAMLVLDREQNRKRLFAATYGVLALQGALFFYYVAHGVDILTPFEPFGYVGNFFQAVPAALAIGSLTHLWLWTSERVGRPALRNTLALAPLLLACAFTIQGANPTLLGTASDSTGSRFPRAAGAIIDEARGEPVRLQIADGDSWPPAAALAIQLEWKNQRWCASGYAADVLFGSTDHACSAGQSRAWRRVVVGPGPAPPGSTIVWTPGPRDRQASPRIAYMR